jgi:hypothetical protein
VIKDFFTKPNGKLSHTKLWSNIASLILCMAFPVDAFRTGLSADKILAFGIVFGIGYSLSKGIDVYKTVKGGGNGPGQPEGQG